MNRKWGISVLAFVFILLGLILVFTLHLLSLAIAFIVIGLSLLLYRSLPYRFTQPSRMLPTSQDQQKIIAIEHCFSVLFDNPTMAMALVSVEDKIIKVNEYFTTMLGFSAEEIIGGLFSQLLKKENLTNYQFYFHEMLDRKLTNYHAEMTFTNKNGESVWTILNMSLVNGQSDEPSFFILQLQNITAQKNVEEKMLYMAYRDSLTDLANRNKLEQYVNQLVAMARRHQQQFAIFFLDLDQFKNINDTIGHDSGDILLQIVAERLKRSVRGTDLVARLSGDEFVVVITDVKKTEGVALIAQKILNAMLKVMVINNHEIYITVSLGISIYPLDGQTMHELIKNADLAMYRAKEQGGNNYQFYTFEMTTKARQKMALLNALGHALVKDEFILHYQPKLEVATNKITGLEALLRWQSQQYRMIAPNEIISLAEETGLIIPVSEWVLTTAFKQVKQWHDVGYKDLTIAVNCSIRQLNQANQVETILRILNDTGLEPSALELEVTESVIMDDPDSMTHVLFNLKDIGIKVSIDDFGIGYWSLNNLRRFSIDKIKIDRTFIGRIPDDQKCMTIVTAILAMANKLGIKVVAEGVETKEQYDFLVGEGCTELQGYYLSPPLPHEEVLAFLQNPKAFSELFKQQEEMR